jgi:hypothetical protein
MAFSHQIIQNFAAPRQASTSEQKARLHEPSSHNWGGYLASEAFGFLLSVTGCGD